MAAARAESVEFEAVGLDGETVSCGHFFLKALDIAVFEFHDFPATGANEVIVMALVRHIVVLRLGAKVSGLGKTGFAKEVQRAINSCEPQMGIFPSQLVIHLLSRDVLLFQECVEDQFTLASEFQLVLPEMILKNSHFFDMFGHGVQAEPPGSELKTKLKSRSRVFLGSSATG